MLTAGNKSCSQKDERHDKLSVLFSVCLRFFCGLNVRLAVMEFDDGRFFMEDLIQQGQGRHNLTSIFKLRK